MAIDPICGMSVNEDSAAGSLEEGGKVYYFCSADCRNQFAGKMESLARLTGREGISLTKM